MARVSLSADLRLLSVVVESPDTGASALILLDTSLLVRYPLLLRVHVLCYLLALDICTVSVYLHTDGALSTRGGKSYASWLTSRPT